MDIFIIIFKNEPYPSIFNRTGQTKHTFIDFIKAVPGFDWNYAFAVKCLYFINVAIVTKLAITLSLLYRFSWKVTDMLRIVYRTE